jgi:RNA polymerase sigma-70 factor, ECF subfamily
MRKARFSAALRSSPLVASRRVLQSRATLVRPAGFGRLWLRRKDARPAESRLGSPAELLSVRLSDRWVMEDLRASAFRRHYADVYRFVRRRTETDDAAEEIAQSVFAQAAARLDPEREGAAPLLAWLYTVAQRRLVDAARVQARRGPVLRLEEPYPAAGQPRYGSAVAKTLRGALAGLPPEQRDVVVLRLLEGRSFAEIAEQLDATEAACKMRFRRGLAYVRDAFEQEGITP